MAKNANGGNVTMEYIYGKDIQDALESTYRVYLCGDLKKPQELQWIHDEKNEIGVSQYSKFTADHPHYHTRATEYNFVISGCSKVLLIDENKEFVFEAGSLFVIPPMTKYASKHVENTKVLFFKAPGGNDKQLIDIDDQIKAWLSSW